MPTQLAKEATALVAACPILNIRSLLLSHINPEALLLKQLLNKEDLSKEGTKEEVFGKRTQSIFTLVCAYAKDALRKTFLQTLLKGEVQDILPLLNMPIYANDILINGLFVGLRLLNPEEQELIFAWMEKLDENNIEKLLTGSEHLGLLKAHICKYFISSISSMFAISKSTGERFLRILEKLSVEKRFALLLQEGFCSTVERGLSFDKDEIFIRWIFSWLKKCSTTNVQQLFFLEKKSITNMVLGMLGYYETTLWHILLSYSHITIQEIINTFSLLDKKNLASCLSEYFPKAKTTPLEHLFGRLGSNIDATNSCVLMIEFLSQYKELQPLLIQPLYGGKDSHIMTIFKRKDIVFLKLFLDKALQVPIYHNYLAKLEEVESQSPEVLQLLKSYKYLVKITVGDNTFDAIDKNINAVLNVRFWRGGTLLHEALYRDNLVAAEFFLKEGASSLALDKQRKTPFDLAVQHKHYDFLKKIITTDPSVLTGKGLMVIYLLGDLSLFEHANKAINVFENSQIIDAQQEVFASLGKEFLQLAMNYCSKVFSNAEFAGASFNPAFWPSIVKMTKSLSLSFIIDVAKKMSHNFEPILDEACLHYLERSLLIESGLDENNSNLFFFNALVLSMGMLKWLNWLKKTQEKIAPALDKALKAALFQITIKPQIFYIMTLEEQKELIAYFGKDSDFAKSLFTFHFRETSLCHLSFIRLIHMLEVLPQEDVFSIWKENQDSLLYMMLISAACESNPNLYDLLVKSFKQMLDKFTFLTLERQYYGLNLAGTEKVNALFLNTQNGLVREPFMQHILKLYVSYCTQSNFSHIRDGSALSAVFLELTCNWPAKCAEDALAIWFQCASSKYVLQALDSYQSLIKNDGNIDWFVDKSPSIIAGVLKNPQRNIILYKWIKVSLDYIYKSGFNPLEKFSFNQFPAVSCDIGKAILSYCELYWSDLLWMDEKQQQTLFKTMLYFAEWAEEEDVNIAPFKKSRLIGLSILLKQYSVVLDKDFVNRLFDTYVPCLSNNDLHCHEFLHALVSLIQQNTTCQCEYLLLRIDQNLQKTLLDRILDACNSLNHVLKADGKFLLQWLLALTPRQKEASDQIMQNLGAQDFGLLQAPQLIKIAGEVLNSKEKSLEAALYDGVWIQRLILSPCFVAAATPDVLENLIDRYKAISQILKQDEYDKLGNRLKYIRFDEKYKRQLREAELKRIEDRIKRLVMFRTEDSIRALLMQLEENANGWQDLVVKKASLHVLYKYYHLRIKNMRNDLLFNVSKNNIQKIFNNIGDIRLAKDVILGWLKKYLPQCYFYQEEKILGRQVELYNQYQEAVGYVDDSNYAMGLDAVKINQSLPAGTVFYDKDSKIIGHLTEEGLFQADSIFQRDTAAMMLRVVPLTDLKSYPKSVDIILLQLLEGASIEPLYKDKIGDLDSEKRCFLEDRFVEILTSSEKTRDYALWRELVLYLKTDKLFSILSAKKIHKNNGLSLLDSCLTSDENVRNQLLKHQSNLVLQILERVDRENGYVLKFLTSYHKEEWFIEAIKILLKKDGTEKLAKSFVKLRKQVDASTLSLETWIQIGQRFIDNEEGAEFLFGLLSDTKTEDLSGFFEKMMILPTLSKLNAENVGFSFKVILHIFKTSYRNLFHYEETRLASRFAWFKDELVVLKNFIFHPKVRDTDLGSVLFLELILRGANFGLSNVFRDKRGQLNEELLHNYLPKSTIVTMHEQNESELQHSNYQKIQQLDARAVINWRKLLDLSWENLAEQDKMSAFLAFLFNYEGSTIELQNMLQDYVLFALYNAGQVECLSKFILKFPEHPVSPIIAKILLDAVIKTPYFLTKDILQSLAKSHIQGIGSTFSWLKWFGMQKHYRTLERCCAVLLQDKHISVNTHNLLKKLATAASVESSLLAHVNKWYFSLYAFFKRLWHGVLQYNQSLSSYIKRVEEECCPTTKFNQPPTINYSSNSGAFVEEALAIRERQKQLRQLRDKVSSISQEKSSSARFFRNQNEPDVLTTADPYENGDRRSPLHSNLN